ncbi:MAG: DUF255 domain-containing protein [Saprospiraceae bacterium]|nr:DUF255 domain-containing protein [Saprospiraceae bacterium]
MKYLYCIFLVPLFISFDVAPLGKSTEEINWMTWDEMVKANSQKEKKIIVDVFTDWCSWCKVMDKQTFANDTITRYINEHFYAVKLNAEQKERIQWAGQEFKWVANGQNGIHTLAYALCDGKMSYPSLVYLNEKLERITISKGFKDVPSLLVELKFAVEEQYLENSRSGTSTLTPIMDGRQ